MLEGRNLTTRFALPGSESAVVWLVYLYLKPHSYAYLRFATRMWRTKRDALYMSMVLRVQEIHHSRPATAVYGP